MIRTTYFRHRKPFLFRPHRYDIGIFLGVKTGYEDNHFLKKIYSLSVEEYPAFYHYHLSHFLESTQGDEQEFFSHVWLRVTNRIRHYELQDPFSPKHSLYLSNISHLIAFRKFLVSIDRWNHHKSLEELLAEKENQLAALKQENAGLNARIAALMEYEPAEKIRIVKGKLPTAIDLFLQLQDLSLADGSKLFSCQSQSPWYKMLARYFDHGEKPIPIETLRNYFPAQKKSKLIKGSVVPKEDKLFTIAASG